MQLITGCFYGPMSEIVPLESRTDTMYKKILPSLTGDKRFAVMRIAFVVGIITLLSFVMAFGVPSAYADAPGGNITDPGVRAVDIAQPAVVRILTIIDGTLTVHFSSGDVTF